MCVSACRERVYVLGWISVVAVSFNKVY
eukprot:COSAG06_NODE_65831_length_256_cov_0.598726_1_plen_27_part_01